MGKNINYVRVSEVCLLRNVNVTFLGKVAFFGGLPFRNGVLFGTLPSLECCLLRNVTFFGNAAEEGKSFFPEAQVGYSNSNACLFVLEEYGIPQQVA